MSGFKRTPLLLNTVLASAVFVHSAAAQQIIKLTPEQLKEENSSAHTLKLTPEQANQISSSCKLAVPKKPAAKKAVPPVVAPQTCPTPEIKSENIINVPPQAPPVINNNITNNIPASVANGQPEKLPLADSNAAKDVYTAAPGCDESSHTGFFSSWHKFCETSITVTEPTKTVTFAPGTTALPIRNVVSPNGTIDFSHLDGVVFTGGQVTQGGTVTTVKQTTLPGIGWGIGLGGIIRDLGTAAGAGGVAAGTTASDIRLSATATGSAAASASAGAAATAGGGTSTATPTSGATTNQGTGTGTPAKGPGTSFLVMPNGGTVVPGRPETYQALPGTQHATFAYVVG